MLSKDILQFFHICLRHRYHLQRIINQYLSLCKLQLMEVTITFRPFLLSWWRSASHLHLTFGTPVALAVAGILPLLSFPRQDNTRAERILYYYLRMWCTQVIIRPFPRDDSCPSISIILGPSATVCVHQSNSLRSWRLSNIGCAVLGNARGERETRGR